MGLFGKSKKEEPKTQETPVVQEQKVVETPKVVETVAPKVEEVKVEQVQQVEKVEQQEVFDIKEYVEKAKFWNYPEYIQAKDLVFNQGVIPAVKLYENLPYQMTEFKRDYILDTIGAQHQRHMVLGLSTILITMASFRAGAGLRKTFRNTVLGYFGVGLFIVPEVYNSALMFHKKSKKE